MKINYKTVLYIVLISCLLGLATNFLNPAGIPLLKEERKLAWVTDSKEVKDQSTLQNPGPGLTEAKAITLKKAYELYKSNAIFVDARDSVEYEISHIKGAISIPYVEFDKYKSVLDTIPKNTPLVAYCDGKECDLSIMLGDKLFETGYKEVYIFFGGWIDWQQANYPIDKEQPN